MFRRHPIGDSSRSYADRGPSGHNAKVVDICGVAALPTADAVDSGQASGAPLPRQPWSEAAPVRRCGDSRL